MMDPESTNPGSSETSDDPGFIERLCAGEETAFSTLVERHHGSLVRLARVFVGQLSVAEEVAQETWLAILRGIRNFDGRSSLKTWMFRILVHRARSRGKREGRVVSFTETGADEESLVESGRFHSSGRWQAPPGLWPEEGPDARLLSAELMGELRSAVDDLPPTQRAVVTMRDLEGLSSTEVCDLLEIGPANQRVLLHRGRTRVRSALEKYFGDREH